MSEAPFQVGQSLRCITSESVNGVQIGDIVTVVVMYYDGRWFVETQEFFGWFEVNRFEPV